MDFIKETVSPARSYTSGLAGIHRPSLDGGTYIQTPNRYQIETPANAEYSESGQRKAALYKCKIFIPPDNECIQMSLKQNVTAAQLVHQCIADYLRTHSQPHPSMLGQPATYRLYLAEDDGELDDAFPPLDPGCVIASTAADSFVLQRRIMPSSTANGSIRSVSGIAPSSIRPHIASMGVESDESQLSHEDGDFDPSYRPRNPSVPVRRISSDADEYLDDPDGVGVTGTRARGSSSTANTASAPTPPPTQKSHKFGRLSWQSCLRCACFTAQEEESEQIEPNHN